MDRSDHDSVPVTAWLNAWRQGDLDARDQLIKTLLPRLRAIARAVLRKHPRAAVSYGPTALVNETYLRLALQTERRLDGRAHFFSLVGRIMQGAVIDQLRRDGRADDLAQASGHDGEPASGRTAEDQAMDFSQALQRLAMVNERRALVLTLRLQGELTLEQIAQKLDVAFITVRRELEAAVEWMRDEMGGAAPALRDQPPR